MGRGMLGVRTFRIAGTVAVQQVSKPDLNLAKQ